MINALTVDLEEYFQVTAFKDIIGYDEWSSIKSRVGASTDHLLDLFDAHNTKSTFFVLGWVAEIHPELVRKIHRRGHEIASHGHKHTCIYLQNKDAFRADIRRAKHTIEQVIGEPICGYRAPSFSIRSDTLWAIKILIEEGYKYDSSIFPIIHDRYGLPNAPRFPFKIKTIAGSIIEFPPTTFRFLGRNFPIAGGGYFRLMPYRFFVRGIAHVNKWEAMPAVFYLHPWEIDPTQPRQKAGILTRIRHYSNLAKTKDRLNSLLDTFSFSTMSKVLNGYPLQTYSLKSPTSDCFSPTDEPISYLNSESFELNAQKVSVIIPVFNESESLTTLCNELNMVFKNLRQSSEWIFIDDGSTDKSFQTLCTLKSFYPQIKIIKLRRNFGQTAAMQAGFENATGEILISMDADLQNDPRDIPRILRRLNEGFDLVCGWRKYRKDSWFSRKLPSVIANKIIQIVIGSSIHDRGCSLKAYRMELANSLKLYSDMHRFIYEVSSMSGARITELVVNHRTRKHGISKYGIARTYKVLSDLCTLKMLIRFREKPMIGLFLLALPFLILSIALLLFSFSVRFSGEQISAIVDVGAAVLFFSAFCFLIFLGLVGEMAIQALRTKLSIRKGLLFEESSHHDK